MNASRIFVILVALPCLVLALPPRCPASVQSPDGSTYSLNEIEGVIVSDTYTDTAQQFDVLVNISICGTLVSPCGSWACAEPHTAAVCAYETPLKRNVVIPACYGSFDQQTQVVGLDGNAGISITYYDGDNYGADRNFSTQIVLNCDVTLPKGVIQIDDIGYVVIGYLEVQGRMGCPTSALPWVEITTYYKGPNCLSDTYMETKNNVATCTPGCYVGSLPGTSIEVSCEKASA